MDRERIERRDFPTGRRGYDPAAVDEHLRRIADEFETRVHQPPVSFAAGTSEQVRLILEAAERGAAELRTQAGEEASDHVTRVQTAADGMLSKLDALESELTRLLDALRMSGERLVEGLAELQAEATAGFGAADESPAPDASAPAPASPGPAEPSPPAASPRPAEPSPSPEDSTLAASSPVEAAPSPATDASPPALVDAAAAFESSPPAGDLTPPESPPLSAPDAPDWPPPAEAGTLVEPSPDTLFGAPDESPEADEAGARLIALNMALSGSPREDTAAYLAEHFSLPDPEALLDDVYARAGR